MAGATLAMAAVYPLRSIRVGNGVVGSPLTTAALVSLRNMQAPTPRVGNEETRDTLRLSLFEPSSPQATEALGGRGSENRRCSPPGRPISSFAP